MADFSLEQTLGGRVVGVDEVGRGPLAGPVLACACHFPDGLPAEVSGLIDDSKKLSAERRQRAFSAFRPHARIAIGAASVAEIDRLNILGATHLAMARAVRRLGLGPCALLIDGNRAPPARLLPGYRMMTVVGGDGRSLSIAAASIAAKIVRDRLMRLLAIRHPAYGWERNAGYGTEEHRLAIDRVGVTRHHRSSFRPLRLALSGS
ncbi:MAG: ribonuclease HII [Alphaproteobacteria bacterium]|nr:ribonuclease HII [Alphaproteobacteria bacterium]